MKILNAPDTFVETSGLTDTGSFTIKQSPKAFQILSSGLYSNKPLAIVRELSCNAYDAHVMVNRQHVPIEVKLPNKLDTEFYVKDFGPGLTHEQVMRLYTTYFDSTKTNSNDFIGGLGLGSKSPFSYTDSFTVESRQNGIARTYGAFVNDDGIPTIALMSEQETTDGDGLTVGFPVKPEDYNSFTREAQMFLRWVVPTPVLKGADLAGRPEPLVKCKGIEVHAAYPGADDSSTGHYHNGRYYGSRKGTWVRMGQVNYPVDWDSAGLTENPLVQMLTRGDRAYILEAPIGSMNVAASREGLQYDKQGKREIAALLNDFSSNLIDYLNAEADIVSKTATGFGAGTHIRKITSPWGFDVFDPNTLANLEAASGKKLEGVRETLFTPFPSGKFETFTVEYFTGTNLRSDSENRHTLKSGDGFKVDHRFQTLVVECDTKGFFRAIMEMQRQPKLEEYYKEDNTGRGSYGRTIVILPNTLKHRDTPAYKEELSKFLETIGSPLLRHTSEYAAPVVKKEARGKKNTVEEILAYNINTYGISHHARAHKDTEPLVWLPIDVGSGNVFICGKNVYRHQLDPLLKQILNTASQYGIEIPSFVAVAKIYQKRIINFKQAVPFDTFLDDFLKNPKLVKALQNPLIITDDSHRSNGKYYLDRLRTMLSHLGKDVLEDVPSLNELTKYSSKILESDSLARLVVSMHQLLGKGPAAKLQKLNQQDTYDAFCEAYPMFSLLTQHGNEDDLKKRKQLRADVVQYVQNRKDVELKLSWSTEEYK